MPLERAVRYTDHLAGKVIGMTRFVVDSGVVLQLAREGYEVPASTNARTTLLRSQMLSDLHEAVHRGELPADQASTC